MRVNIPFEDILHIVRYPHLALPCFNCFASPIAIPRLMLTVNYFSANVNSNLRAIQKLFPLIEFSGSVIPINTADNSGKMLQLN